MKMSDDVNMESPEMDDFVNNNEVEMNNSISREETEEAEAETEEAEAETEEAEAETDEVEKTDKRKPSERIRELVKRNHDKDRTINNLVTRLENLEKGLTTQNSAVSQDTGTTAPDPTDSQLYPLGHLDDRYIEDKLEWLTEQKAAKQADAVLQRQQENERQYAEQHQQTALLEKVDDLASRGSEIYDDFQEKVVDAGMRGDWALSQTTFEATHEAENGAQILYELSKDRKEASRVANLSAYQQIKFVQERDAVISGVKQPRRIPRAGEPPKNIARGANSRTSINPATSNPRDFEKLWMQDDKSM
jgi:hypothetical protein